MDYVTDLVSIIMPAHNAAKYLHESLDSVRNQTYQNWELIFCNDQSTDETEVVFKSISRVESRFVLENVVSRGGPAKARNAGIRRARGRWIALLDSDDVWESAKLEATLSFAKAHQSFLTYTSYQTLPSSKRDQTKIVNVPAQVDYSSLLKTNHIATSTVVIDRHLIPRFEMVEDVHFDDFVTWLRLLKFGGTARGLDQPLTRYRRGHTSFSSNKIKSASEVWKVYRRIEELPLLYSSWLWANYSFSGFVKHFL